MTESDEKSQLALKRSIREQAKANRQALADKDRLSDLICRRLAELPEYAAAQTILSYIDARAEVRTWHFLAGELAGPKQIAVPYCSADRLKLFRLQSLAELAEGSYQILEPRADLRDAAGKQIDIGRIDLAIIPGVAFDRRGNRLGHGKGYYDRLLAEARPATVLFGLAFECQLFPAIPTAQHDMPVDAIVTEQAVYRTGRRLVSSQRPATGDSINC